MATVSGRPSFEEDNKLCTVEADAAIKEVAFGVKEIKLASSALPFHDSLAYVNLTTLEGEQMCIEISAKGFCPVGSSYDSISDPPKQNNSSSNSDSTIDSRSSSSPELEFYETIYALLSARSRLFRDCFSQQLSERLKQINQCSPICTDE